MNPTDPSEMSPADDADPLMHGLLAALERLLSSDSAESAGNCHELADFLAARGQTQEAGLLYERALAINRRIFGNEHPDVALTLHNLALLRQTEGRLDEANFLWAEARAAFHTPNEAPVDR